MNDHNEYSLRLQKIPKYTIHHDMTLLQVIISRYNIHKKSILIWCYGTKENFHLWNDFEHSKLACQESKICGIFKSVSMREPGRRW